MARRSAWFVVAVATVSVAACSGDGDDSPAASSSASEPRAEVFEGDADSEFCVRSRQAASEELTDPFSPGLDAAETERRLELVRERFSAVARFAPVELEADLDALVAALESMASTLEAVDYDLSRLTEADRASFDGSGFGAAAARIDAYQSQVCGLD